MRIRRFEAPTVQEALQKVRQDLGPLAVILYTKRVRRGGFFGWMGTEMAEVTAGVDATETEAPAARTQALAAAQAPGAALRSAAPRTLVAVAERPRPEVFQSELNDGKVLSGMVLSRPARPKASQDLHPELKRVLEQLLKNGVEEGVAQQAMSQANREILEKGYPRAGSLGALVSRVLGSMMRASGPIDALPGRCRVIAFIGPTGVGKTTSLVKLASQYSLIHQLKVALLTADTYRIGAVEQLRIYRDIIDIPFEAVNSADELSGALKRYADRDLIFFDTAGRSPQNRRQIADLKAFMEVAKPAETHLCVSATTKNADLLPSWGSSAWCPSTASW